MPRHDIVQSSVQCSPWWHACRHVRDLATPTLASRRPLSAKCMLGHPMRVDTQSTHYCDVCGRHGTVVRPNRILLLMLTTTSFRSDSTVVHSVVVTTTRVSRSSPVAYCLCPQPVSNPARHAHFTSSRRPLARRAATWISARWVTTDRLSRSLHSVAH